MDTVEVHGVEVVQRGFHRQLAPGGFLSEDLDEPPRTVPSAREGRTQEVILVLEGTLDGMRWGSMGKWYR